MEFNSKAFRLSKNLSFVSLDIFNVSSIWQTFCLKVIKLWKGVSSLLKVIESFESYNYCRQFNGKKIRNYIFIEVKLWTSEHVDWIFSLRTDVTPDHHIVPWRWTIALQLVITSGILSPSEAWGSNSLIMSFIRANIELLLRPSGQLRWKVFYSCQNEWRLWALI